METSPVPENLLYAFPLSSTSNVSERGSVRFHPLSAGLGPPLSTRTWDRRRSAPCRHGVRRPPACNGAHRYERLLHFTPPLLTCDDTQLAVSKPVKQRSKWSEVEYRGASRSQGTARGSTKGE